MCYSDVDTNRQNQIIKCSIILTYISYNNHLTAPDLTKQSVVLCLCRMSTAKNYMKNMMSLNIHSMLY